MAAVMQLCIINSIKCHTAAADAQALLLTISLVTWQYQLHLSIAKMLLRKSHL